MYLTKKIYMLGKLHSYMSYSAVGCEFNIHESTTCIKQGVLKQTHKKQGYVLVRPWTCQARGSRNLALFGLIQCSL